MSKDDELMTHTEYATDLRLLIPSCTFQVKSISAEVYQASTLQKANSQSVIALTHSNRIPSSLGHLRHSDEE